MKILEITKKYEKGILFTFFVFGIIGIFWTFLADFGLGESDYNFLGKTKKVTLSPGAPVTQTFIAHENNMHQIRVVLGRGDIKRGEQIEFRLMNEICEETLATKIFHSEPRSQGVYTVFDFPAITNSKDRTFCFSATYFSDENRKGEKPYLSATDISDPLFSDRTLTDTNKNRAYPGQTLFLRPAYTSGSLSGDLSNLVNRLSQYKPVFLKGWTIVALFTILLIGSIALAYKIVFIKNHTEINP